MQGSWGSAVVSAPSLHGGNPPGTAPEAAGAQEPVVKSGCQSAGVRGGHDQRCAQAFFSGGGWQGYNRRAPSSPGRSLLQRLQRHRPHGEGGHNSSSALLMTLTMALRLCVSPDLKYSGMLFWDLALCSHSSRLSGTSSSHPHPQVCSPAPLQHSAPHCPKQWITSSDSV